MKKIIYILFCLVITACIHDPVGEDYYNDLDKIKGGKEPMTPQIVFVPGETCENIITISSTKSTDPEGEEVVYYLYVTDKDVSSFTNSEYYNKKYYQYEVSPDPADNPFKITINIQPAFSGTVYIWITAFDGGRESYKSDVLETYVPGGSCP